MLDTIMVEDRIASEKPDILAGLPRPTIPRRQRKEVVMADKRCTKCEEVKSLDEFFNNCSTEDGKSYWCKECTSKANGEYKKRTPEKQRKYREKWRKANSDRVAAMALERRIRGGDSLRKLRRVWDAVERAIERGEIVKPDRCEGCNRKVLIFGHHENYDEPLVINWFCSVCHRRRHDELRKVS